MTPAQPSDIYSVRPHSCGLLALYNGETWTGITSGQSSDEKPLMAQIARQLNDAPRMRAEAELLRRSLSKCFSEFANLITVHNTEKPDDLQIQFDSMRDTLEATRAEIEAFAALNPEPTP